MGRGVGVGFGVEFGAGGGVLGRWVEVGGSVLVEGGCCGFDGLDGGFGGSGEARELWSLRAGSMRPEMVRKLEISYWKPVCNPIDC